MKNEIPNSKHLDKSYQYFNTALWLLAFPLILGIVFLIEPYTIYLILMLTPIWGIFILLSIFFSSRGILKARKLIQEKRTSSKTKTSLFGNIIILKIGLTILISVITFWVNMI